jgi:predicted metal-dependent phosphoesterase TrpH
MPRAPHPTGMASGAGQTSRFRFGTPDLATLREDGYTAVDMHVHTEHSDGLIRVTDALRRGRRIGASFAITDHNAVSGTVAAAREADPGQIVVPGIEVSASEGPHLLLYFYTVDDLVDFHDAVIARALGGCPHMATTLPTADVLDGLEGWDALAVAAHPFGYLFLCRGVCKAIGAGDLAPDTLLRLDGLEGICGGMTRSQNERTVTFAREHGLALTGGTDAHLLGEIGQVVTAARADSVEEFLDAVRRGDALVWGQERSTIQKTFQVTSVLPQYAPYIVPSLGVHYRQNLPRALRYLRRIR